MGTQQYAPFSPRQSVLQKAGFFEADKGSKDVRSLSVSPEHFHHGDPVVFVGIAQYAFALRVGKFREGAGKVIAGDRPAIPRQPENRQAQPRPDPLRAAGGERAHDHGKKAEERVFD